MSLSLSGRLPSGMATGVRSTPILMQEPIESITPFRIDVRETHAGSVYFRNNFVNLRKGHNRARVHLSFHPSGGGLYPGIRSDWIEEGSRTPTGFPTTTSNRLRPRDAPESFGELPIMPLSSDDALFQVARGVRDRFSCPLPRPRKPPIIKSHLIR